MKQSQRTGSNGAQVALTSQHAFADRGGQVRAMPDTRVVGMRMRQHRTGDGAPRVDVKITRGAVQALGAQHDQVFDGRHRPQCVA